MEQVKWYKSNEKINDFKGDKTQAIYCEEIKKQPAAHQPQQAHRRELLNH